MRYIGPRVTAPAPSRSYDALRRIAPWLIGLAIIAAIARHIPFAQFQASLGQGPHLRLALSELVITAAVLCTDTFSTWVGMLALRLQWPIGRVLALRGSMYLLFLLNYAAGQGGFGYALYKTGVAPLRATGATLFLIGTNLASLLLFTFAVWALGSHDAIPALWWSLVVGTAGLGVYLFIILLRPSFLARRELLAPLFEAGVAGHVVAIVGRLPHVIAILLAYWVAMRVWGLSVPFAAGATLLPAVALAAVLPISPAGLGTTQAAMVALFSPYAVGATADERAAAVLAFGVAHFVYGVLFSALFGAASLPFAKRAGLIGSSDRSDAERARSEALPPSSPENRAAR